MVLHSALLNIQYNGIRIKSKVEQTREWVAPSQHLGVEAFEKVAFVSPTTKVTKFTYFYYHYYYLLILFTNPSARAGYDTRSIFKRSLTGLNSEFSFS